MEEQSDINVQDIVAEWRRNKSWVGGYTRDFPDLDTLADGISITRVKNAPAVGSVTLAGAVRQIPKNSIQQVPVFSATVNGTKHSKLAYINSFLLRDIVFNHDTFGKGVLSTIQTGAEAALTRGFQVTMPTLGALGSDFGTIMRSVHYNDFAIEKGVSDFSDSGAYDIRTRISKSRLKKLIKSAESNPETTWNVPKLKELLTNGPDGSPLPDESEARDTVGDRGSDNQYDIITRYETGPYHDIIVFSEHIDEPLRVHKSRSKFGYPRLQALVLDPAQISPFGISRARLASPMANYANVYLQSTAKMQLLNADPPVHQSGQFTTPVKLRRGALIKSIDPNAKVNLLEMSNSTLRDFRSVLDYVDNQILSIMGVGQARSKSSAYVNQEAVRDQVAERDLSVAQVTNILENYLRQYGLTALDLFISEQIGTETLIVDDECKDAINKLEEQRFIPTEEMPEFIPPIGDDNTIEINWEEFYDAIKTWTVNIDLSMGKNELEAKTRADLQDAVTVASQTTDPNDPEGMARKAMLEDELFKKIAPDMKFNTRDKAPLGEAGPGAMPEGM